MAVEGGEADAEMGRVGLAKFRDVVGDRAAGLADEIRVAIVQEPQQGRFRAGPGGGAGVKRRRRLFHRLLLCIAITVCATGPAPGSGAVSRRARSGRSESGSPIRAR